MLYEHANNELFYMPDTIAEIFELYESKGVRQWSQWMHKHLLDHPDLFDIAGNIDNKTSSREISIAHYLNTNPHVFYPALAKMGFTIQPIAFYVSCKNNGTDIMVHLQTDNVWVPIESKRTGAKLDECKSASRLPARGANLVDMRVVKCGSQIKFHPVNGNGDKDGLVVQILQKHFHDTGLFFSHYRGPETDFIEVFTDIVFVDRDDFNDIIMLHHECHAKEKHLRWDGKTINLSIPSFYNKFYDRCVILQTLCP